MCGNANMLPRTPAEVTAIKVILMAAGLLFGGGAMACKQLVAIRQTFVEDPTLA